MELDCQDRSDEIGCCKPVLPAPILPPPPFNLKLPATLINGCLLFMYSETDDLDPATAYD